MTSKYGTLRMQVDGMHCQACEITIQRRLAAVPGVRRVIANHSRGSVMIEGDDISAAELAAAASEVGYQLREGGDSRPMAATAREFCVAGAAFVIVAGAYLLLRRLGLLPDAIALPDSVSYGAALVLGLAASVSTCMAVTGGLLVAVAARYDAAHPGRTGPARLVPHLWFAVGRLLAYPVLGAAVGALGAAATPWPGLNAGLMIAASVIMIIFGLQMLGALRSLGPLQPRLPQSIARGIDALAGRNGRAGAFTLGALSFLLPCGFTQALQLYVLAQGDAWSGAGIMLAFAAGTLPALLSLSMASSFGSGAFRSTFTRFAGIAVVLLGVFNIQSGLTLATMSSTPPREVVTASALGVSVAPRGGKQVVEMKIIDFDYVPNQFSVSAGTPVEWRIDASRAAGCGRILLAPSIGVQEFLHQGKTNVITFTPEKAGTITFNCGMGMMTPDSKFTVR